MAKSKEKKKRTAVEDEGNVKKKKRTPIENEGNERKKETPTVGNEKILEPLLVKIKTIGENLEKKSSPMTGYFPSGYDPSKASTDLNSSIKVYKNSRNPDKPRMLLVVGVDGSPQLNFVGTSYSGEAATQQVSNYALGILDKKTGILKLVPLAANKIFRMETKLSGGLDLLENEPQDEAKEEIITKEENDDRLRNTNNMYNSVKSIRRDEKREAMRQKEDPETRKELDKKLKGIKINMEALEADTSTADGLNIPPYDLDATAPEMAYPLDKIILNGEWDYLLDIFELAQAGMEVNRDDYPSFVCNRVSKLKDVKDESKKRRMAGVLSYITHLIKFKDRHSMDGVSSAKRHKLPSILSQKFTSMFGTRKEKRIPDEKQHLLINYVLVLSLFVDDFRTDVADICKDLRMDNLRLRTHYGYLGCKLVRENQATLATLPLPLKFETVRKKRRRGN
ncbi:hypothetical protein ACJIZ3_025383 [Penstemon smallii]|uniref:DNA-directed RNA polymerase I subunit rpa49 n=1 Tax=Penstemon smallii TaxID=265156 RepID=A0ABD3TVI4_9LAMI